MRPRRRRLLLAIAAWPLGVLLAILVLGLISHGATSCPSGETCSVHDQLRQVIHGMTIWRFVPWVCLALGPGVFATGAWWRNRSHDAPE